MRQPPIQGSADSVPVLPFLSPATRSLSAFAPSAKSYIYRFYAESLANSFIYRIYAKYPGLWGSLLCSKLENQSPIEQILCFLLHPFNPCSFNGLRTLLRNRIPLSPFLSIGSALF